MFPIISVSGTPFERGVIYGTSASERIQATINGYRDVFETYADMEWEDACKEALKYEPAIKLAGIKYVEEMAGIAKGADVLYEEILAINCRSEIMFAGLVKGLINAENSLPLECTSFAALPTRTVSETTIIGQNWDWLDFAQETVVVLAINQDDAPNIVTVVEAGLLAKAGMNDVGIGLVTNALVSELDTGGVGLPYHVALRKMLDCKTVPESVDAVVNTNRATSANYLVASKDGLACNIECRPGNADYADLIFPVAGYLAHTNHFCVTEDRAVENGMLVDSDSLSRLEGIESALRGSEPSTIGGMMTSLRSHDQSPNSVCMHLPDSPELMVHPKTVASIIMDLGEMRMWIAAGLPCLSDYEELDLAALGIR